MVQAEVGRVELDARLRNAPPEQSPHVDGDITPGLLSVTAILSALFQRERTGEGQHLDVSMAEALVYTDEWTSTDLAGYDGPRIPDTWNYPIFRVADGTDVAFMGDPTGRLVEIAAAISDDVVEPTKSREEAWRILADLVAQVPDFPTLEARFDLFGFLVSEVRTVQQLAETPWAEERGVFVEVEPGSARRRRARSAPTAPTSACGARHRGSRSTPERCSPSAAVSPTPSSPSSRPTASSTPRATSTPPVPTGSDGAANSRVTDEFGPRFAVSVPKADPSFPAETCTWSSGR